MPDHGRAKRITCWNVDRFVKRIVSGMKPVMNSMRVAGPGSGHGRTRQGRVHERGAPPVLQVTADEIDPSGLATAGGRG